MVITIHLATTIVDNNQASMWSHCPIEDNPADMLKQRSEDDKEFPVLVIAVMHELFSYMEISQWAGGSIVLSTMNEAEKHLANRLQDYTRLIADRRYVTQIEAPTKDLLHNAMDKLCNELGMHCIALKIKDKVKIH
ncbi:hypothetical protein T07_11995 [Trichinella nelsoni]|uniref:Uncharacterized protein n=1 Tax=Trichinella nelsoni TaxID=6336 RepID=A0A0V0RXR1_9BILA|nr:hypothetical protein T07_11995 [Trichinella nelsoni]